MDETPRIFIHPSLFLIMKEDIIKSLALLIGGALISGVAGFLVTLISSNPLIKLTLVIVTFACIAFGLG